MKSIRFVTATLVGLAVVATIIFFALWRPRHRTLGSGQAIPPGRVTPRLVCSGDRAALIAADGSLWAWGGTESQLVGLAEIPGPTEVPRRIGTESDWMEIALGWRHTVAIKTNGSLWAWGTNSVGQLGRPDKTAGFTRPVQLGSGTNWVAISTGVGHILALTADGMLWGWGENTRGQIGNGGTQNCFKPVLVTTAAEWRSSICCARRASSSLGNWRLRASRAGVH